jgi:hypothetical protein
MGCALKAGPDAFIGGCELEGAILFVEEEPFQEI